MKIFITGGAGFIGSAVVRMAVDSGHEILNLDSLSYAANLSNISEVSSSSDYNFVKGG